MLHAHLPFVRHPETNNCLEERWLFEAITETYIPMLQVFQGLIRDGVDFRITMSLTPTLLTMLTDELLQRRYLSHINSLIELAEKEVIRTKDSAEFNILAREYMKKFKGMRDFYLSYACNLVTAYREIMETGKLEIITSAATHAFLPLVMTEQATKAQIKIATAVYHKHFGRSPRGIWLPECGFLPGLDLILKECGLEYFFTDSHGVGTAQPTPVFGLLSPVLTPHGLAAFPRDTESSRQVWSSQEGYPGDFDYREYYRDIGYDLDFETIRPYIHPEGIRINTGIKYYRITGTFDQKEPYNPQRAKDKAAQHAANFLFNRQRQIEHWSWHMGRKPIVVAPYDAELFGHWWYEGPMWIDMLLRKMHFDQAIIKAITPSEYLQLYTDYQVCSLPMSSWGRGGCNDVWLGRTNDWIYPALHLAEQRMIELADQFQEPGSSERRALNQAARELMLAQSSDWAFTMDSKTMVEYAVKRTKAHFNRFCRLYKMLKSRCVDEPWLSALESMDNIFPEMDFHLYSSGSKARFPSQKYAAKKILMLCWEYPPITVGGLSRHVYDLARFLARQGLEVHVVTIEAGEYPHYEVVEGVHVHRFHVVKPDGGEFIHWVFQLNLMMIETCCQLIQSGLSFDIIHAHDWLACYAAKTLKQLYDFPLVATIHATEHGRNNGIHTDLQRHINDLEWRLTYEAEQVIVCSTYMRQEVESIFALPSSKVAVIPNGVDPELIKVRKSSSNSKQPYAMEQERLVLFVGRLVQEKGVHTLLAAAPSILAEFPEVKFIIAGKGPAMSDLKDQVQHLGIREKVLFTGFVGDEERNRLLQIAEIAVFPSLYEPFGIVAIEAMAAGTTVVVSEVGGLADVVEHGRNGLKMYAGDVNSLTIQVKDLLRNPEWARSLARSGKEQVGRFDWNSIAAKTIAVYGMIQGRRETKAHQQIAASDQDC